MSPLRELEPENMDLAGKPGEFISVPIALPPLSRRQFCFSGGVAVGGFIIETNPFLKALFSPAKGKDRQPTSTDKALAILTHLNPLEDQVRVSREFDENGKDIGTVSLNLIGTAKIPGRNQPTYAQYKLGNLNPKDAHWLDRIVRKDEGYDEIHARAKTSKYGAAGGGMGFAAAGVLGSTDDGKATLGRTGLFIGGVLGALGSLGCNLFQSFQYLTPTAQATFTGIAEAATPTPDADITPMALATASAAAAASGPPGPPSPTPTIEVKETVIPRLLKEGKWASFLKTNEEKKEFEGNVDFRQMFRLVGSVENKHRRMVDLTFGDKTKGEMKVAIEVDQDRIDKFAKQSSTFDSTDTRRRDLKDVKDHMAVKSDLVQDLENGNNGYDTVMTNLSSLYDRIYTEAENKKLGSGKTAVEKYRVVIGFDKPNVPIKASLKVSTAGNGQEYVIKNLVTLDDKDGDRRFRLKEDGSLEEFAISLERKMVKVDGKEETEFALMPKLKVVGKKIFRADTNEEIKLQGITIDRGSIRNLTAKTDKVDISIDLMKAAKSWGSNCVTISYNCALVREKINDFITLAEEAEKNGMYIAFIPASKNGVVAEPPIPDQEMIATYGYLAEKIKPYSNNVLMDVYYEPHPVIKGKGLDDDQAYNNAIFDTLATVRAAGYEGPLMIPGNFWSRRFTGFDFERLKASNETNIIFRPFDSPETGDKTTDLGLTPEQSINGSTWDKRNEWMVVLDQSKAPVGAVMLGEYGFVGTNPLNNSARDKQWQDKTYELVNQYGLSFVQYAAFDTYKRKTGDLEPNVERGRWLKDYLQKYPPMQMDQ